MKKIRVYFICLSILASAALVGCSCGCGSSGSEVEIPDEALIKSGQYIASFTGDEFFEENIHPDYINSKYIAPNYELHFNFRMLDHGFVDEDIFFTVDSAGNILDQFEIHGIPKYLDNPNFYKFNINENDAIEIARNAGLSTGIKEWKTSFYWIKEYDRYLWHVLSVISETGDPHSDVYKAKGEEIFISPSDGSILTKRKWQIH